MRHWVAVAIRRRRELWLAPGVVAMVALTTATPAYAYEADGNVVQTAEGAVAVSCSTPNPAGAEASPTISSQGVTLPPLVTPPIVVPPVVIGPTRVGPETVGPYTAGGETVPSQTFGGGTYGQANQADEVVITGASNCAAVNVTNPGQAPTLAGSIRLGLYVEELNPATDQASFVEWSEVDQALTTATITLDPQCALGCPGPAWLPADPPASCLTCDHSVSVPVGSGSVTELDVAVPGAGALDPRNGNVSLGVAEVYLGVILEVSGLDQPTGTGCEAGDFSCSSATFAVC